MSRITHICPDCLELNPEIIGEDVGVGGTYYGSSYEFDSKMIYYTECCTHSKVALADNHRLNDDLITRYLRRFGLQGAITEWFEIRECAEGIE